MKIENFPLVVFGKLRAIVRLLLFFLSASFFILSILIIGLFTRVSPAKGVRYRQQFCRFLMPILGIQITKIGKADYENVLFISNHRSYIDPFVQVTHFPALVVAKMEIRSWPIIGYGVKITGTYFVKREEKSSRAAARADISKTIKEGQSILLYPEGTTTKLPTTLPFKPRTFHMAADNQVKIVPIAIEYQDPDDAWVGDDTFVPHFLQVFAKRKVVCEVHYGEPMWDKDGDLLREKVQAWVNGELTEMREKWGLDND